ncbi:uncharacterized protein [Euwallacea fornicatus]|uniref:uncharacterized protein isoform X2 n=1 Tax=Euwallacea fornicatus TaxID=995702 RepID=UPI0033903A7F
MITNRIVILSSALQIDGKCTQVEGIMDLRWAILILVTIFNNVNSQNIGSAIALVDCYNASALPGITIANERPPATINMLVEFIRKLEDANPVLTPRELSVLIIRSFRQDGIARTVTTVDERFAIPYAASRVERHKFRAILRYQLPIIQQTLNYGDLNSYERCSLHYLMSNTVADQRRDNEATECVRAARYTARVTRDIGKGEENTEGETELINQDSILEVSSAAVSANISTCPIELGVIQTQSGTVKAGNVLAGIATGLNQESITYGNGTVYDNRYASTIAGELCETILNQATDPIELGNSGGWNSSIDPKYFFLQSNAPLQTTDAELRGALDGLYIGLKMSSLNSAYPDLKISQLIDMYYSPYEKEILDGSLKGCNRSILYTDLIISEELTTQLVNYMAVLFNYGIARVSLLPSAFPQLSKAAVTALTTRLTNMAKSDVTCRGPQAIERVVTNLLIFIDSSWPFSTVQPVLSYILNNVDVNKYQSKFTIYGGNTLRNLTANGTRYLSDFYLQYNRSIHINETTGFDYIGIFQFMENYGYAKLDNNSYTGGESTIALLIPKTSPTQEQNAFLSQRREVFNSFLPDITFLVLGSGDAADYSNIISNTNRDFISLQESTSEESLSTTGQSVASSIREIPRSLVNPVCTSQYTGSAKTFDITGYVESLGTNYYRIAPRYFYSGSGTRNLKIREQGYGTINICISRDNIKPGNSTGGNCTTLSSSESVTDITNFCDGSTFSSCQPIYISVNGANSTGNCKNTLCRFPTDIQYTITLENVGCANGSIVIAASALLVLLLCVLSRLS